ncbi:MAG: hypothetical protein K6C35_04560 [Eubacterium sp.]|nr:hypothetical protein [Eubacterium sp.]
MFVHNGPFMSGISSFLYIMIIMAWGLTVERRITNRRIRRLMYAEIFSMGFFFVIRICKYVIFYQSVIVKTFYSFYAGAELLIYEAALLVTLQIGRNEAEGYKKFDKLIILINAVLIILALTNNLHEMVYRFGSFDKDDYKTDYGWLYFVIIVFMGVEILTSLIIMIRKCTFSAIRKYWYMPVLPMAAGTILLVIYLVCGGAPEIYGYKIYNIHEVICGSVGIMLETGIKMGLIPSCSGYGAMFRRSHINAAIIDKDGEYKICSLNYDSIPDYKYARVREKDISGGRIKWMENLKAIYRLNSLLSDALEIVETENTLIEKENAAKEERSRYEAQNRLYNSISRDLEPEFHFIDEEISREYASEAEFRKHLSKCLIIGAYIKRRANLTLISAENDRIHIEELILSINECLSYIRFYGIKCRLNTSVSGAEDIRIPAEMVLKCFDLMEEAVEGLLDRTRNLLISIRTNDPPTFKITMDAEGADAKKICRRAVRDIIGNPDGEIEANRASDVSGVQKDCEADIPGVQKDCEADVPGVQKDCEADIRGVKSVKESDDPGVQKDCEADIRGVKSVKESDDPGVKKTGAAATQTTVGVKDHRLVGSVREEDGIISITVNVSGEVRAV